jgi:mannose-6-phosphate isomerase-like protein (cupin superfamily)
MRIIIGVLAALFALPAVAAGAPPGATNITAAEVQAFLRESPRDRNTDRPIRVVDAGGYRVAVFGVFRPREAPVAATAHQTSATEVYYMLEGAGMLVTGGTQEPPATPRASTLGAWTDIGSSGINGGVARRVGKGDIVIIPGGVPHMWRSVEADITYLIIRADPDSQIPLK